MRFRSPYTPHPTPHTPHPILTRNCYPELTLTTMAVAIDCAISKTCKGVMRAFELADFSGFPLPASHPRKRYDLEIICRSVWVWVEMLLSRLQEFGMTPSRKISLSQRMFWLSLSLTFAALYAGMALAEAFSSEYVVQDDARQHVFWMLRFIDGDLFPNDLIADYFQSVAPAGYSQLYQSIAHLGISPLAFNKFVPMGLGLMTTAWGFGVCLQILPVPLAAFASTVVLNLSLWMKDDLVSGTPRAFLYPLFLAFLYYLLRRQLWPMLVSIALMGWFYPQFVLIESGMLVLGFLLGFLRQGRSNSASNLVSGRWQFYGAGLAVALVVILPYALQTNEFGPTITLVEARNSAEFWPGGRSAFFHPDPWYFLLQGERSGFLPVKTPTILWVGVLLPVVMQLPKLFPLARQFTDRIGILWQILAVSLGLFLLSYACLFELHLPSRYTQHSLRIVLAMASGMVIAIVVGALVEMARTLPKLRWLGIGAAIVLMAVLVLYPLSLKSFPKTVYKTGEAVALYEFLQQTPKDVLIASLDREVDNLPAFTQRSILAGREYAIPYHLKYANEIRDRTLAMIRAQYDLSLDPARQLIEEYGIDFWLLHRGAFTPEYITGDRDNWLNRFLSTSATVPYNPWQEAATVALETLQQGQVPALAGAIETCSVFADPTFVVLDANCIVR